MLISKYPLSEEKTEEAISGSFWICSAIMVKAVFSLHVKFAIIGKILGLKGEGTKAVVVNVSEYDQPELGWLEVSQKVFICHSYVVDDCNWGMFLVVSLPAIFPTLLQFTVPNTL